MSVAEPVRPSPPVVGRGSPGKVPQDAGSERRPLGDSENRDGGTLNASKHASRVQTGSQAPRVQSEPSAWRPPRPAPGSESPPAGPPTPAPSTARPARAQLCPLLVEEGTAARCGGTCSLKAGLRADFPKVLLQGKPLPLLLVWQVTPET